MPRADFNDGDNEGSGFFEVNQQRGLRWNAAKAFLRPALRRPNLRVVTHALTERLVLEGKTRRRRALSAGRRSCTRRAPTREVLLAAGAINSPKLLELSGIGRPDRSPGPRHRCRRTRCRGVGENLQDHLQIRTVFKVAGAKTLNAMFNSRFGKVRIGAAICADAVWADVDGAEPVRHVHQVGPVGRDARSRISCPAAVDGQARRSAASVSGNHRVGLQPAAGKHRQRACDEPRYASSSRKSGSNYLSALKRPRTSR